VRATISEFVDEHGGVVIRRDPPLSQTWRAHDGRGMRAVTPRLATRSATVADTRPGRPALPGERGDPRPMVLRDGLPGDPSQRRSLCPHPPHGTGALARAVCPGECPATSALRRPAAETSTSAGGVRSLIGRLGVVWGWTNPAACAARVPPLALRLLLVPLLVPGPRLRQETPPPAGAGLRSNVR
jgi:hypothetical protein